MDSIYFDDLLKWPNVFINLPEKIKTLQPLLR
jgi:hypothetical protein